MPYVYPKLCGFDFYVVGFSSPGLGNLLFPWARAICLAKSFDLVPIFPVFTLRIARILKFEKDKRFYLGLFKPTNWYLTGLKKLIKVITKRKLSEEEFLKNPSITEDCIVIVQGMKNYFLDILKEHEFIRNELIKITKNKHKNALYFDFSNSISVHIRLGDFLPPDREKLRSGAFNIRLPLEWYIDTICEIRNIRGDLIKVYIFSDGTNEELKEILRLPNVERISFKSAIGDLLALSRAKFLISSGSTFAMWASFLGRMPTVYYPGQLKQRLYYENSEYEFEWERGKIFPNKVIEYLLRI